MKFYEEFLSNLFYVQYSTLLDNYDYEGNPLNKEISEQLKEERITESDLFKYLRDMVDKAKTNNDNSNS